MLKEINTLYHLFHIILHPAIYFQVHQVNRSNTFYELKISYVMLCTSPFSSMHIRAAISRCLDVTS